MALTFTIQTARIWILKFASYFYILECIGKHYTADRMITFITQERTRDRQVMVRVINRQIGR